MVNIKPQIHRALGVDQSPNSCTRSKGLGYSGISSQTQKQPTPILREKCLHRQNT